MTPEHLKPHGSPYSSDRIGEFVLYATLGAMRGETAHHPIVDAWAGDSPASLPDVIARIKALGLRIVLEQRAEHATGSSKRKARGVFLYNDRSAVFITQRGATAAEAILASTDPEAFAAISVILEAAFASGVSPIGKAYAITQTDGGPASTSIGRVGVDLEPANYTPEAIAQYTHLVQALAASDVRGRLSIIDGPPGTGKTYMLRALMQALPAATFVVIPPGMTEALSSPSLLPVLLDHASTDDNHWFDTDVVIDSVSPKTPSRLVLVIEDADEALVPRDSANLGQISALLNLSDGIIGHSLDLQIIATTNATLDEIDPALTRAGRLLEHIHVGLLPVGQATRVLQRLKPGADPKLLHARAVSMPASSRMGFGMSSTGPLGVALADIYDIAAQ